MRGMVMGMDGDGEGGHVMKEDRGQGPSTHHSSRTAAGFLLR